MHCCKYDLSLNRIHLEKIKEFLINFLYRLIKERKKVIYLFIEFSYNEISKKQRKKIQPKILLKNISLFIYPH